MLTAEKERYSNTVEREYDEAGRIKTESLTTHGETYPVAASYAAAGRLTNRPIPTARSSNGRTRPGGELETVTRNAEPVLAREYDDGGRFIEQTFGNGIVEEFAWNDDGTCQSIDGPAGLFQYSYDLNQNRTAEAITGALSAAVLAEMRTIRNCSPQCLCHVSSHRSRDSGRRLPRGVSQYVQIVGRAVITSSECWECRRVERTPQNGVVAIAAKGVVSRFRGD